jgi:CDP-diacylglycerol---glycerol-3-phosphate 3-phosphatidyltransferase
MFNLPISLTLFRVALIPLFVLLYYAPVQHHFEYATLIFIIAAATDWLDGFLARKLHQTTDFGAFLDPVADKLLVIAALVMLVAHYQDLLFTFAAFVIIAREITVSALREWMALRHKRVNVQMIAKIKTVLQLISISAMILNCSSQIYFPFWFIYLLLYVAVGLTIWSMIVYLMAALPDLQS